MNFVLLVVVAIHTAHALSPLSDFNPRIADLRQECGLLTDCFNCTLANCDWDGRCSSTQPRPRSNLTASEFFRRAPRCGDPLGFCWRSLDDLASFGFKNFLLTDKQWLPAGYFCLTPSYKPLDDSQFYLDLSRQTQTVRMAEDGTRRRLPNQLVVVQYQKAGNVTGWMGYSEVVNLTSSPGMSGVISGDPTQVLIAYINVFTTSTAAYELTTGPILRHRLPLAPADLAGIIGGSVGGTTLVCLLTYWYFLKPRLLQRRLAEAALSCSKERDRKSAPYMFKPQEGSSQI